MEVADLVTHRFCISKSKAVDAYQLIETRAEPYLGVELTYPTGPEPDRAVVLKARPASGGPGGVGLIGAGAFASTVLLPALKQAGFERFVSLASASGLSARRLAERAGFERAVSGAAAVIDDLDVDVVVIATPRDTHAALVVRAFEGKHVFCEKPLALTHDELDQVGQRCSRHRTRATRERRWPSPGLSPPTTWSPAVRRSHRRARPWMRCRRCAAWATAPKTQWPERCRPEPPAT